jgi:hypothetical protein
MLISFTLTFGLHLSIAAIAILISSIILRGSAPSLHSALAPSS